MLLPIVRKRFFKKLLFLWMIGLHGGLLGVPTGMALAAAWPFDQRQVLLVRTEGHDYPDDLAIAQILDAFVQQGRVRWILRKGGKGEILPVVVPRDFEWQSELSVRNLALRHKADGLVLLDRNGVRVDLHWYSALDGKPLFFEGVTLPALSEQSPDKEARALRIRGWVADLWAKIPGRGYVMGRELNTFSFEGGPSVGLKEGDGLEVYRIELTHRHPLLRTLTKIEATLSGTGVVTRVGSPLSEARIDYESSEDPIQAGDRYVIRVAAPKKEPLPQAPTVKLIEAPVSSGDRQYLPFGGNEEESDAAPLKKESSATPSSASYRLFDVGGRAGWSTLVHSETVQNQSSYKLKGGGPAFDVQARAYITRNWVLDGKFGFRHYSPQNNESSLGAVELGAGFVSFQLGGGYRFIFIESPEDPGEFTLGLGYQSLGFSVTRGDAPVSPVGKTYSGIDFRFGLKVPARENLLVYAMGSRVMGASVSESPLTTAASSAGSTLWNFDVGALYRSSESGYWFGGIESSSASSNFEGTGERAVSALSIVLTHRVFYGGYQHRF